MSNWLYPALKYIGKQALNKGFNVASDVIENGDNIKTSIKKRSKQTLKDIGGDVLKKARKVHGGNGKKAKQKKNKIVNKKNKPKKSKNKKGKQKPKLKAKGSAKTQTINKKGKKGKGKPKTINILPNWLNGSKTSSKICNWCFTRA